MSCTIMYASILLGERDTRRDFIYISFLYSVSTYFSFYASMSCRYRELEIGRGTGALRFDCQFNSVTL